MSRWYRAYEGTVTDAKLGEVALVAETSRSVAIAAWHCLLESAATVNDAGRFDFTARRVAVILGEPVATIERVMAELTALGMIADGVICAWSRRQYESDKSTERSRKHRETKRNAPKVECNGDATLQQPDATPPDTDTDTDTEKKEPPKPPRGFDLPEWVPLEPWSGFLEMRTRIRKPMTDRAKRLAVDKLEVLKGDGHSPTIVLNQSTLNSWQDLFPPRRGVVQECAYTGP
jgi:hypothetical protein